MKNKLKKAVAMLLSAGMILSNGVVCKAAEYEPLNLYCDSTEEMIYAKYTHTAPVSFLRIKMDYREKHTTTGDIYTNTHQGTASGGCTMVSTTKRYADAGYKYTNVELFLYIDSQTVVNGLNVPVRSV